MRKYFEISKLIMLLCLPAALWLISNKYVNKHYHILNNGQIIAHSHPYENDSEGPIQDHRHCDFEYTILAKVSSNSSSETVETDIISVFLTISNTYQGTFYKHFNSVEPESLPRLRAPPKSC